MMEHRFNDEFGPCEGCGKYVEQLMGERYCSMKIQGNPGQAVIEERAKIRGDFTKQSKFSQELKQVIRFGPTWNTMTADQREALDHIQEKIARLLTGDPNELDAWLDLIGYPTLVYNKLKGGSHVTTTK